MLEGFKVVSIWKKMLGYIIQVPINWGQSNINLFGFLWLGALSSQAEGAREISDNHHCCSQLCEDGVGG